MHVTHKKMYSSYEAFLCTGHFAVLWTVHTNIFYLILRFYFWLYSPYMYE